MKSLINRLEIDTEGMGEDELLIYFVQNMKRDYEDTKVYISKQLNEREKILLLDAVCDIAVSDNILHEDEEKFSELFSDFIGVDIDVSKEMLSSKSSALKTLGKNKKLTKLQLFDKNCADSRRDLIRDNYSEIIHDIHNFFQKEIVNAFSKTTVKEIVKFDYMTNLFTDGDKFLWIKFIDEEEKRIDFEFIQASKDAVLYFFDEKRYLPSEVSLELKTVEKFSYMCLGIFRRGYSM
jgi:hypothetical protein